LSYDHWSEEAVCVGEDPSEFYVDHARGRAAHVDVVDRFCSRCPVKTQCWNDSSKDDRRWTIVGGKFPNLWTGGDRGEIATRARANRKKLFEDYFFTEKEIARYNLLLEKGVCSKGLHSIANFEDMSVTYKARKTMARSAAFVCRECKYQKDAMSHARIAA